MVNMFQPTQCLWKEGKGCEKRIFLRLLKAAYVCSLTRNENIWDICIPFISAYLGILFTIDNLIIYYLKYMHVRDYMRCDATAPRGMES